jgi:hypothetical protein
VHLIGTLLAGRLAGLGSLSVGLGSFAAISDCGHRGRRGVGVPVGDRDFARQDPWVAATSLKVGGLKFIGTLQPRISLPVSSDTIRKRKKAR